MNDIPFELTKIINRIPLYQKGSLYYMGPYHMSLIIVRSYQMDHII